MYRDSVWGIEGEGVDDIDSWRQCVIDGTKEIQYRYK